MGQLRKKHKPTLVFIPGTLCTSAVFDSIISKEYYTSITLDFSSQCTLEEMCNEIKNKVKDQPFIPVGFSMGGMVAFEFIRNFPNQVLGLILLNSNAHADVIGRAESRVEHLNLAKANGISALIRDIYLPIYFENIQTTEANFVVQMAEHLGISVFEAQLNVLAERPDSIELLKNFDLPTLIVGSENDVPCPTHHQKLMAKSSPISELHIIEDCGHFAILEKPMEIKTLINNWVAKHYE